MSDYPMVQAKWFTRGGNEVPTRIVVHRMEAPEKGDSAESCARYFQTVARPASAHLCADNNSIVRCVLDGDIAFHAPPNKGSLGIEHAGTGEDWGAGGQFDIDMLALSAKAVARWCRQYNIPAVWLTPDELRAGAHGITSHYNVTQAWHQTTHTDGQFFPFAAYLALVRQALALNQAPAPAPPLSLEADLFFLNDDDRDTYTVYKVYLDCLGRLPESMQVVASRLEELRSKGTAALLADVAASDEAKAYLAKR